MKIKTLTAATALMTVFAASNASALSLKFDGWTNGNAGKSVNVVSPGYNGAAGAFDMKDTNTQNSFVVFCLDIVGKIYSSQTYDYKVTDTPFSNSDGLSGGSIERLQKIFESGYATALTSSVLSAGFQVAVWNAVYDDDWSVASGAGTFYQTADNDGVRNAANNFLAAADGYEVVTSSWKMNFLEGLNTTPGIARSQNLVTVEAVPLPAAGLMLFTALGGLFVARRRKTG